MLDIKYILENKDLVKEVCKNKNVKCDVDRLCELYSEIKSLKIEQENAIAEKNKLSKEMAHNNFMNIYNTFHNFGENMKKLVGTINPTPIKEINEEQLNDKLETLKKASKEAGEKAKLFTQQIDEILPEYNDLMLRIPQIYKTGSIIGGEDKNDVIKTVGEKPSFSFEPLGHYDICEKNNWLESKKLPNVCGPRTYCTKGELARLELAMATFVIDKLIAKGFTYMNVPAIVKPEAIMDAGHFQGSSDTAEKLAAILEEDVFQLQGTGKCLAGTAEIVLNSLYKDEILKEDDLPILMAGYSHAFRKEAGAAGKDTRGLVRVHEFHKVEQFIICKNSVEESAKMHAMLLEIFEEIMVDLELPYHVLENATGDMGFNKYCMNDVEAWVPSEGKYRELGSCSSIHDFQARRTNTRYRENGSNEVKFCHTLNNTGIALPRALVPVLENHQNADGSVNIPLKLQGYMGGKTKIGGTK